MKKILLIVAVLASTALSLKAQKFDLFSKEVQIELKLWPEQLRQVEELEKEFKRRYDLVKNDKNIAPEEMRKQLAELSRYRQAEMLNNILMPAQKEYVMNKRKQMKAANQ